MYLEGESFDLCVCFVLMHAEIYKVSLFGFKGFEWPVSREICAGGGASFDGDWLGTSRSPSLIVLDLNYELTSGPSSKTFGMLRVGRPLRHN